MRRSLARLLRRLAEWLDPVDPILVSARQIVAFTATLPRNGPYKAAVAIGRMRLAHPGVKDSRLRWAIETAVQGL